MMVVFAIAYLAGAGLLALWLDVRFPMLRPSSWMRGGIAAGAAMVADELCGTLLGAGPPIVSVMAVGLPMITGTLLVCIWLLRLFRSAMPA